MSRSSGAILADWVTTSPSHPDEPLLSAAVIEAIAKAPLSRHRPYSDAAFLSFVRELDRPPVTQ